MKKSITAFLLIVCTLLSVTVMPAAAANEVTDWFLRDYPDPHFNLAVEPTRAATVEEFIAYVTAKAYYAPGSNDPQVADKAGKLPSSWCGKYVQAEINKKTFDPKTYAYSEIATVAFSAEYISRCRGLYHWDHENTYSFSNTGSLTAEQKMYLNVAVDHQLIPYTAGMNVMQPITRAQLGTYAQSLMNQTLPTPTAPAITPDSSMKEVNVYFPNDTDWDTSDDIRQFENLKKYSDIITMVSFSSGNIGSHGPNNGVPMAEDSPPTPRRYLRHYLNTEPIMEAIDYCNEKGILPLMVVGNYGKEGFDSNTILQMLSSESNMDTAISEIMWMLQNYHLKGVNIGFEHVDASGRDNFVRFLTKLRAELDKQNMVLLTTVGAYFRADHEDESFFNYDEIGKLSDYVHFILYDDFPDTAYNAYRVEPGPMSGMVGVDRVMRYAVNRIPSGKILLGLSTFAIDYDTTGHTASDERRQDILPKATAGITSLTDGSEGGMFNYTDASGHSHVVYLESVPGIKARVQRLYRYNLCGASVFHLDSDFPELMDYVKSLSGFKAEIMDAAKTGLIPNKIRNSYTTPITRAQFCDVVAAFVAAKSGKTLNELLAEKGLSIQSGQFKDTTSPNVLAVAALGIVNGRGEGVFAPNDTITRREAAAMLTRLAGCFDKNTAGASMSFTDVEGQPNWAKESIGFISSITDTTNGKRVMGGTGNNQFSPLKTYTRQQAYMTAIRLFHAL